jgi:hypothetical protein
VVLSPKSVAVGRSVAELPLVGNSHEFRMVGISHIGQAPEGPMGDYHLQAGDAGVIEVDESFLHKQCAESEFIVTRPIKGYHRCRGSIAPWSPLQSRPR